MAAVMNWATGFASKVAEWFMPIFMSPEEKLRHICEVTGSIEQLEELLNENPSLLQTPFPLYFTGKEREGYTPLTLAARSGHLSIVDYLIIMLAVSVAEKENRWGATALHHACRKNHVALVSYLIGRGANVDAKTNDTNEAATPLHWSASYGQICTAQVLVNHGCNVNAQDQNGSTPLHWACFHGQARMAKWLTDQGADMSITNKNGSTAADLMESRGFVTPWMKKKQLGCTSQSFDHDHRLGGSQYHLKGGPSSGTCWSGKTLNSPPYGRYQDPRSGTEPYSPAADEKNTENGKNGMNMEEAYTVLPPASDTPTYVMVDKKKLTDDDTYKTEEKEEF